GMNEIPTNELFSLLMPLAEERLIVPRACVAEVVTWQAPEPMEGAPPWYLGTVNWSGRPVPVISFEATWGHAMPPPVG
ncbi:chemotaxis protein CheW, partial [Neisseria sp. P0009.S005]|uniref:chemotaxis protein CheW n=1 Tax=Neisseria sp. P0009.S005 TaxID=3436712 RepID=UPI003F7E0436